MLFQELSAPGAISTCGSITEREQAAADGEEQWSSNRGLHYAQTAQYSGAPGTLREGTHVFITKMLGEKKKLFRLLQTL